MIESRNYIKGVEKKNNFRLPRITLQPNDHLTDEDIDWLTVHLQLKLQIELVPTTCWWLNVRSNLTSRQWDKIRHFVYNRANFCCEVCGQQGTKHPVECHEVWSYDEANLIQELIYFEALCPLCHEVKHIGWAEVRGNVSRAFERFQTINHINSTMAQEIIKAVIKHWKLRSLQNWEINIQHLSGYPINLDKIKKLPA
jgi:hypothetical protein